MNFFETQLFVARRHRWVEDAVPDGVGSGFSGKARIGSDSSFLGTAVGQRRIFMCVLVACVALFFLLSRTFYVQIVRGASWRKIAEQNRMRTQPIIPERGIIFDRSMVPLVTNVPNFRLTIRAQDLPRDAAARDAQIRMIGETAHIDTEKIQQVLDAFRKYHFASVVIKDPVSYDEAVAVYLKSGSFPSVTIERSAKRAYVAGIPGVQTSLTDGFSHVLGYVGRISPIELDAHREQPYFPTDVIGKTGIEQLFETYLRGTPGMRDAEVDVRGAERRTVSVATPGAGASVVLTIDEQVQRHLESGLRRGLALAGVRRGSAIAIDPRDGAILGMVSLPAYDNNSFSGSISATVYAQLLADTDQPLLNRAVSGQFPSGSTIKPFYAAAALQENVITPTSTVVSTGGVTLGSRFFADWKSGGHGVTNVTKAIAESVNTFFYYVGGGFGDRPGLGPDRMKKYLEYFGFGRVSASGFTGETTGFIPSPAWKREVRGEQWFPGDTFNMAIGQGDILVTPLQLATALSSIVNGGVLWKPRVVHHFVESDDSEIVVAPVVAARVPVDDRWLSLVREGMRQTVLAGSARSLQSVGVPVAGKTGTAQWSSTKNPHAWFMSYAPAEAPEIVTVFLIEEGREGSSVAVPAAREFYTWWSEFRKNHNY